MTLRTRAFTPAALTASIAALLALPLRAQSPAERLRRPASEAVGTTTLSEVVVRAQSDRGSYRAETAPSTLRLEAPLLDTPRSVGVVTQQVMEDRQINDPQEAVQNVSGVVRSASFTSVGENFLVRGFQQGDLIKDSFRAGANSNTGLVATGPTDMANLERIEVLKGPASILFGRGEPGGAVNYVTKVPAFENRFSFKQQVGTAEFYRSEIGVNWNAVPDKFALRLDAAGDTSESFIDYVEGERWFFAPAFKWQIGADTTLTFRGEYSHDERSSDPGVPYLNGQVVPGIPYHRYFGEPGFTQFTTEQYRGLLELEHRWSDGVKTKLALHGRTAKQDGAYFILFNFAGPSLDPVTGELSRGVAITDFQDEQMAVRLDQTFDWTIWESAGRTVLDKDGKAVAGAPGFVLRNQLLLSAEYERETRATHRILGGQAPINAFQPTYRGYAPIPLLPFPGFPLNFAETGETEAANYSLLLMDRVSFGETVHLSFGGRVDGFEGETASGYPDPTIPFGSSANAQSETYFSPFAGLVVKPARNLSLYASYSESVSPFGNLFAPPTAGGETVDAEESRQYEAGVKTELFNKRLIASAALFQIEKRNVVAADPKNPFFSVNAGEERSRGFEVDLAGEPLPGWKIIVNYACIDARVTADPSGATTGHRRYGVPEHSGGLFTTYEIQDGPLQGLGCGAGAYFSDRVETSNQNTGNLSGWVTAEALIYYRRDRFRVQLNVKNLTDEEYYQTYNVSGDGATVLRGGARSIIGSVKFEF